VARSNTDTFGAVIPDVKTRLGQAKAGPEVDYKPRRSFPSRATSPPTAETAMTVRRAPGLGRAFSKRCSTGACILDAELTAIDSEGHPDFGALLIPRLDSDLCVWFSDKPILARTALPGLRFGGFRHWFKCPSCGRRCRILYGGARSRCRLCKGARYESQFQHPAHTTCDRRWRLRERLEERGGMDHRLFGLDDGFPPRPKGMHHKTYRRRSRASAFPAARLGRGRHAAAPSPNGDRVRPSRRALPERCRQPPSAPR
jgi:hypothetical protein